MVLVTLAVITATTHQFVYTSEINYASAKNNISEVKAHYLARSVINLARLLLKVQDKVLDRNRMFLGDIQLAEFMPMLLPAFFGQGAELLAGALGVDPKDVHGLEYKKSYGTATLESITSEDGKLNVNCAYVRSDQDPQVVRLATSLLALIADQRYNLLFETADESGNYNDRETVVAAILDYIDMDTVRFGQASAAEDYGYGTLRDPYEAKNNIIDSTAELHLVRGITDDFWANFGDSLTVYGHCMPNLCAVPEDNWTLMASILMHTARDPQDPVFQDPIRLRALSKAVLQQVKFGGCTDLNTLVSAARQPMPLAQMMDMATGGESTTGQDTETFVGTLQGVELDPQKVTGSAYMGARRIYKMVARAEVGRVVKRITAVWDQQFRSPSTGQMGAFVYWKEE
jgi:type II secretory pathway component PulK